MQLVAQLITPQLITTTDNNGHQNRRLYGLISLLSIFVVKMRQTGNIQLTLQEPDQVLWQTKSLKNLQRLMPSLTLEFL